VAAVIGDGWLADTRISYDTVAASYAEMFRGSPAGDPYVRAALELFTRLVRQAGDGPVADVGCGTGRVTGYLAGAGLDTFGVDLSPGMVEAARQGHPGLRFEVGSMTELDLPDGSLAGLLAWWSLIHVPDEDVPGVFAHFRRVLRPGGVAMLGFFAGDERYLKTEGYGGHPMRVHIHRRPASRVAAWLGAAGFRVDAQLLLDPVGKGPGAVLFAHREP
jgi:SAM-dependent methyltransferase